MIIGIMMLGSDLKNLSLKRVIDKICLLSRTLKVNYFPVLRGNNVMADKMANLALGKAPITLGVDDDETICPPHDDRRNKFDQGLHRYGDNRWQGYNLHMIHHLEKDDNM